MAQINDSQVSHPVITFQVNLATRDGNAQVLPNRTQTEGNETTTEAANMSATRSLWLPGLTGAENLYGQSYNHGDQFTVKGAKATYLKNLYVTGSTNDILSIVSES